MTVGAYIDDHCDGESLYDLLSNLDKEEALTLLAEYFRKAGKGVIVTELAEWVYDDPRGEAIELVKSLHKGLD